MSDDDNQKLGNALKTANQALSNAIALSRNMGIQPNLITASTLVSNAWVWWVQGQPQKGWKKST